MPHVVNPRPSGHMTVGIAQQPPYCAHIMCVSVVAYNYYGVSGVSGCKHMLHISLSAMVPLYVELGVPLHAGGPHTNVRTLYCRGGGVHRGGIEG